jgi:glycosyltransferase involved in cell wall biosynthesis
MGYATACFKPLDAAYMAEKIDWLLGDQAKLASLTAAGLERVKTFSWEVMAQQTLEVYDKVNQAD